MVHAPNCLIFSDEGGLPACSKSGQDSKSAPPKNLGQGRKSDTFRFFRIEKRYRLLFASAVTEVSVPLFLELCLSEAGKRVQVLLVLIAEAGEEYRCTALCLLPPAVLGLRFLNLCFCFLRFSVLLIRP